MQKSSRVVAATLLISAMLASPASAGYINLDASKCIFPNSEAATSVGVTGTNPQTLVGFLGSSGIARCILPFTMPQDAPSGAKLKCGWRAKSTGTDAATTVCFKFEAAAFTHEAELESTWPSPAPTVSASVCDTHGGTVGMVFGNIAGAFTNVLDYSVGSDCGGTTCNGEWVHLRISRDTSLDTNTEQANLVKVTCEY